MKPFENCPVCGGDLENRMVEKLLRGGVNTLSMQVSAEVCLHCGERLYAEDVIRSFEEIRAKLQKQDVDQFTSLGRSFTVGENWLNKAIQPSAGA